MCGRSGSSRTNINEASFKPLPERYSLGLRLAVQYMLAIDPNKRLTPHAALLFVQLLLWGPTQNWKILSDVQNCTKWLTQQRVEFMKRSRTPNAAETTDVYNSRISALHREFLWQATPSALHQCYPLVGPLCGSNDLKIK